jgi:acyl dehydratase
MQPCICIAGLLAGRGWSILTAFPAPAAATGVTVSDKENLSELQQHLGMSARITTDSQVRNHVLNASLTSQEGASPTFVTLAEAQACIGQEVGITQWFELSQKRVNQFAEATGDFQFIHIDRDRALAETPYGGTIAHGFLTLSLLSMLASQTGTIKIKGSNVSINYGLDKVRFLNPVKVGKRIRARFELMSAVEKSPNCFLLKHKATVEIENEARPAMIAEWLVMAMI